MKIKLLMAPSLIVIIIVLLIWYVYPAFTDPLTGNGVKEKAGELKKEKQLLEDAKKKSETIDNMALELNSQKMTSSRELVMEYMPESIKEYEIIDNLNYLVLKEELQGTNISVSQPVLSKTAALPALASASGGSAAADEEAKPQATLFLVDFSAQGGYEKIKSVFEKIFGLKRFNRLVSIKIDSADAQNKGSDNLKAVAVLEFAFLKESGNFSSLNDPVFSKSSFDLQTVGNIEKGKATSLMDLQVDQKGKTNPFIP
ncbi:MAG TPA: hypothetical protein P5262_03315 [Candidatus Moranbacteria bacterium]|nr:hypothetical protein [Candidatus Moranbacteria bacterium]